MESVKIFISGSRAISRLSRELRQRLNRIIEEQHLVLLGDANGADKAVQQFLADHHYSKVIIFFTGTKFRNNIGHWQTVAVTPPKGVTKGFEFYAAKDRAMAEEATHGLLLWDGESRGTFTNLKNLVGGGKPAVVYLSPKHEFITVRKPSDIEALATRADSATL